MDKLMEFLPFLIPFIIIQFCLFGYTLYHVLTHEHYKRGNRMVWLLVSLLSFVGPIAYFLLGKEEA